MGILISRFRKKASTKELLENIENELENIDDFRFYTQQKQKRMVGSLIIYSIIVYIAAALIFYFYYFPSELSKQILYSLPLIVFPVIIWIIKQLLHWYYRYRLSQNDDQIMILHREKKKLLKEVMEKETYKVAKEILEKYDPEHYQKKPAPAFPIPSLAPNIRAKLPETEIRKRSSILSVQPLPQMSVRPAGPQLTPTNARPLANAVIKPGYNAPPTSYPRVSPLRPSGIPMPCPILPQQRGVFDRMVEYVVGDGPNNRYALICRQCQSHNGMSLREEFEFIAFRCCYCYSYNPARKQRPMAPRLSLEPLVEPSKEEGSDETGSSSDESGREGTTGTVAEDHTENKDSPVDGEMGEINGQIGASLSMSNKVDDTQLVKPSDDDHCAADDLESTELGTLMGSCSKIATSTIPSTDEEPSMMDDDAKDLCPDDVSSIGTTNEEVAACLQPS